MTLQGTEIEGRPEDRHPQDEAKPKVLPRIGLDRWYLGILLVLLLAIVLRAWGIGHGLPFVYNPDERSHFVHRAVGFFGEGYNPHYFVNPPAFTYFVHLVLAAWYRSGHNATHAYLANPTQVFLIARVSAAALGVLAVWLLYLTGQRLCDRRVGLLGAGLLAVAFLPVFYSHLALNDAPTLAPITLSLFGTAGVLGRGRRLDYVIAGIGVGLGAATKYPAAMVALPLLAATVVDIRSKRRWRGPVAGLALAALAAVASFVAANPYSILDFQNHWSEVYHSVFPAFTVTATEKLGQAQQNGFLYYLWTLTWGLGWVPIVAALGGAVLMLKDDRRRAAVLLPAPILFLPYMGSQARYFGRWIMPIFPFLILLAAYSVSRLLSYVVPRFRRLAPVIVGVAVVALLGQGLVTSMHTDIVLARPDTRGPARQWILANIPWRTLMVVEPTFLLLKTTGEDYGVPGQVFGRPPRWKFFDVLDAVIRARAVEREEALALKGGPQGFARLLWPGLIDLYERAGACWVVTGSLQWGRAFASPGEVPDAVAYYRELRRRGKVVYRITPYGVGQEPVPYNFDWSTDYYPLAYVRPGPEIVIYRLTGGECA